MIFSKLKKIQKFVSGFHGIKYNAKSMFMVFACAMLNITAGFSQNKFIGNNPPNSVSDTGKSSNVMPSIASWNMRPELINMAANRSPFRVLTSLGSAGKNLDHMDDSVHNKIKIMAADAAQKGISLVADLDVRMALPTFGRKYPDELQQMLVLRKIEFEESNGDTLNVLIRSREIRDHYHRPYQTITGSLVRVYAYNLASDGAIDSGSLKDITQQCIVDSASKRNIQIQIIPGNGSGLTRGMVMVSFTYLYPDTFAPHLMEFQRGIIRKYADVQLAGALSDEWGFPAALSEESITNEFWYTKNRADVYAERTGGRDLVKDILLMHTGIKGQEDLRNMAINHFREMSWQRNGALENNFYDAVKDVFGPKAIVAVHPTWFPYPEAREFKKNGLDWWVAKRDWAQTDEVTPFAVRTSLAKKWKSPVWYNMFYRIGLPQGSLNAEDFEQELWSSALAGGRVNNLSNPSRGILGSNYVHAERRIRLLNYIKPSPLNCPVAVVFGHAAVMNWNGPYFEDVGVKLADSLWSLGIAADLIPTSEIENGHLIVGKDGSIQYGDQRYEAVILYNPEFEKISTSTFFKKAAKGKTRLFRIGNWSKDFDGKTVDGNNDLPKSMKAERSSKSVIRDVTRILMKRKIDLQSPATRIVEGFGHTSLALPTTGFSRLLNGTLIQIAGTKDATGDTVSSRMKSGKYYVEFDAVGLAAVNLDDEGQVQALAAGGLRSFKTENFSIQLDKRIDLAFWLNEKGMYEGLVQDLSGDIPPQLLAITKNWTRIERPASNWPKNKEMMKKVFFDATVKLSENTLPSTYNVVKDIDGNPYQTVKIGDQEWMAENLKTSRYNDGSPILLAAGIAEWSDSNTGAYSSYSNDLLADENLYGKLYNWHVVKSGKICPVGWHVPSEKDWNRLLDFLGAMNDVTVNSSVNGNSQQVDQIPAIKNQQLFNPSAAGYRHIYGSYMSIGKYGIWWSSTNTNYRAVWNSEKRYMYLTNDVALAANHGLCIRCIKDN